MAALAPARGPGPRRITFVTSPGRCTLRCRMCRDHSPLAAAGAGDVALSWEAVAAVLDERRGSPLAEVIPSTRGEPLLWPAVDALVARCAADGLRLNLTTNGTWPRHGAAGWGARLAGVASDVKVSWNGATAATAEALMQGLRFDEAVEGVRALVAARGGFTVSFQVTAQERNVGELPAIVALAARLGVDRVKVNQLQVHFPELASEDLRRSPESRARWNAAVRAMRAAAGRVRLQNVEEWGASPAEPGPCPFLGREAWVLADGSFAACPAEVRVGGRTIGELWGSREYAALLAGYERRPGCAGCAFRRAGGV